MKGGALLERAEGALVDLNVALREMGAESETLQRVASIFRQVRAGFDGADWPEIRLRYEVGGLGLSELARRFGVNKTTIGMRAEREKWTRPPGFDARAAKRASLVGAAVRRRVVAQARPATDRVSARRAALLELIGELAAAGARSLSQDQLAKRMKSGSVVPDIAALVADGALAVEHGGRKGVRYTVTATGQATDWTSPPKPKPKATKTRSPRVKAVPTSGAGASTRLDTVYRRGEGEAGRTRKRDAGHKAASPASDTPAPAAAPLPLLEALPPQAPPSAPQPVPAPAPAPAPVKREPGRPRSNWTKWQEPAVVAPANTVDLVKRYLQQRGIVVFAADVVDRPDKAIDPDRPVALFKVDGRNMSTDGLIEKAMRLGFQVRA